MASYLSFAGRAWIAGDCAVAFVVILVLRHLKGAPLRTLADLGWAALAALVLMAATGAVPFLIAMLLGRQKRAAVLCRWLAVGLLVLVSALMIANA